jgi:hypothetical protein
MDLASATFSIVANNNVLLHSFTPENKLVMKEYMINATENHLVLKFQPLKGSTAFVNAIEVVNAPDELITDLVHARAQQHAFCICVGRRQKEKRERV